MLSMRTSIGDSHVACSYFQGTQELLLTGIRNSGELLMVQFVRSGQRQAEIKILLKDTEGRIFTTPDTEDQHFLLDISHGNKYQVRSARRSDHRTSRPNNACTSKIEFRSSTQGDLVGIPYRLADCECSAWSPCGNGESLSTAC